MVTELGYCNLCEKQKQICREHHCSVCYELYCENCYYETIYENDNLCQKCSNDYNKDAEYTDDENDKLDDENDKSDEEKLKESVRSLQLQNETFKQKQCLLIALETIDLRSDIRSQDIVDIKYTIKELLYNNSSDVVDDSADLYKTIIEKLSGLKVTSRISGIEPYTVELSVL